MRVVLVCGDRNWADEKKILYALEEEHGTRPIDFLVEGGQKKPVLSKNVANRTVTVGADYLAKRVAKRLGIQTVECEANWEKYGPAAGPIRNEKQLELVGRLAGSFGKANDTTGEWIKVLAFHSDLKNSKGTKDMVRRARKVGWKVKVIK